MRKSIQLTIALFFAGISMAAAQSTRMVQTIKISTPAAQCELCKEKIENYLRREDGIQYVNVNFHNGTTTVRYLSNVTNPDNIRIAIANVGFDADTVTANPDFYAKLPPCCKKGWKEQQQKH